MSFAFMMSRWLSWKCYLSCFYLHASSISANAYSCVFIFPTSQPRNHLVDVSYRSRTVCFPLLMVLGVGRGGGFSFNWDKKFLLVRLFTSCTFTKLATVRIQVLSFHKWFWFYSFLHPFELLKPGWNDGYWNTIMSFL